MKSLHLKIVQNKSNYGDFVVTPKELTKTDDDPFREDGRSVRNTLKKQKLRLCIDGHLLHCILRELSFSAAYRDKFLRRFNKTPHINDVVFSLVPVNEEIIDYGWNYRITYLVRERCELEHALSWLSTLGGAFSALGDYFTNFSLVAGKISHSQLTLATRMGDPSVAARSRLYYSLSLIQQHNFKLAKQIIKREYYTAKNAVILDSRLVKMCLGIWSKLQYEHQVYKQARKCAKFS